MSSIYTDDLLRTLPSVLKNDKRFHAFATVMAKQLRAIIDDTDTVTIYARIDALPEALLDILAYDFKVDWWDYGYTIEEKRQTLKDSFLVHKHLGTKYAVETAISAIYPKTTVQEWFEYGGDPYTFRLLINVSGRQVDLKRHTRVLELTNYYKNLRSHLGGIEYTVEAKEAATFRMGGQLASIVKLFIPELADEFTFESSISLGGSMGAVASINIPEVPDAIKFTHSERIGGRIANITTISMPNPQEV